MIDILAKNGGVLMGTSFKTHEPAVLESVYIHDPAVKGNIRVTESNGKWPKMAELVFTDGQKVLFPTGWKEKKKTEKETFVWDNIELFRHSAGTLKAGEKYTVTCVKDPDTGWYTHDILPYKEEEDMSF